MIFGVFSDVHDNINNLEKVHHLFKKNKVKQAFFCGDLVSPFTLKYFKSWQFPISAVFGNNEGDKWGIKRRLDKYSLDHISYPERGIFWDLLIDDKKIAVFHGHDYDITQALLDSRKYDLVFTGHTHEPHVKTISKTIWINPGSVTGISENPSVKTGSVVVYDTKTQKAKVLDL